MRLFKYVTEDRIDILRNGLIRFTQPVAFNDPFEMRIVLKPLSEQIRVEDFFEDIYSTAMNDVYNSMFKGNNNIITRGQFDKLMQTHKPIIRDQLPDQLNIMTPLAENGFNSAFNKFGVLSLTENIDNLIMWAHYANSHQGFVIEFDADHEFFNQCKAEDNLIKCLKKVDYYKDRPKINFADMKGFDILISKSIDWKYENEWRMILPLNESTQQINQNPYDIHLFKIPFNSIKSITLGCRTLPEKMIDIVKTISTNVELNHISIYQMAIHKVKFSLTKRKIDISKIT